MMKILCKNKTDGIWIESENSIHSNRLHIQLVYMEKFGVRAIYNISLEDNEAFIYGFYNIDNSYSLIPFHEETLKKILDKHYNVKLINKLIKEKK